MDLYIGGIFFTALLVPPCSAIAGRSPGAWFCALSIAMGIGVSWLMPVRAGVVSVSHWMLCMLVLLSFAGLLVSAVELLIRFSLSPSTASGIVTIASVAWLTWPVWLCTSLAGDHLHWSILFHPLFAINHELAGLGIWTEQQMAYRLTNLGQDVQYELPGSAWPVIGLQMGFSVILSLFTTRIFKNDSRGDAETRRENGG